MKRDVVWSDDARTDMDNLIEHIAKESIQSARLVVDRIEHSVELLTEMQFGRAGRVFDTRRAKPSRYRPGHSYVQGLALRRVAGR
jgi:plasmid stabilization system protein ParE